MRGLAEMGQEAMGSRIFAAIVLLAGGLLVAETVAVPLLGGLLAALAGGCAFALFRPRRPPVAPAAAAPAPAGADLSQELMAALDEPSLLVRNRRVVLANPAARALLGEHIDGADVRLAIRHPAAAEWLVAPAGTGPAKIELTGVGDRDRRWEMHVAELPNGSRLVRLIDRSAAHAAEQVRADFVANASHELRTPLATLLGYLETLQDDEAASDAALRRRFVGIMLGEARRMHRLVDDLISLSRIEAERFSQPRDRVSIGTLVEEARVAAAELARARGSAIEFERPGDDPAVIGDHVQLAQLVANLLDNALQYGRAGAPVRLFAERHGDLVRFAVQDRGDGIAPEHLPRLTERFYRAEPSRSRALGGTGLGLAIAKQIVERHRGRLQIDSRIGVGTRVTVDLPAADPLERGAAPPPRGALS